MSEPYLGEIRIVSFGYPPPGWALCNGQSLPIAQNAALFGLIGVTYGGDGVTSFNLPSLQGRVPIDMGQGASTYNLGQTGGSENVALTINQIPAHSHQVNSSTSTGTQTSPVGNVWAQTASTRQTAAPAIYAPSGGSSMSGSALSPTGGNQPHENRQPFLVVNFIIAVQGIYPSHQ